MTLEKNTLKELKKISDKYFQKFPKEQKIAQEDISDFFTQVSLSLIPQGSPEEKEFLKSDLIDNWWATCEYRHCQEMVNNGDLKAIKEFISNVTHPAILDIWLRSAISYKKTDVFKLIADDKLMPLNIELAKLAVIYQQYEILDYYLEKYPSAEVRDDLLYTSLMCESQEMGIFLIEHGASVKNTYEVIKADLQSDAWVIIKYSKQLKWLESQEKSINLKEKLQSELEYKQSTKKTKI